MKIQIFLISLCLTCVFALPAQDKCDTLKWKTIETYYRKDANFTGNITTNSKLDGAVINIDTLSIFYPGIEAVNISNDTFFENTTYAYYLQILIYADTGLITGFEGTYAYFFSSDRLPGGMLREGVGIIVNLNTIVNAVKGKGLSIEDINHLECFIGVGLTTRDWLYSDSVFYLGADTSIFYITKTPVSIHEAEQSSISVYPNPAYSQFTVTNTENANITLYNILGQEVRQVAAEGENTIIYTGNLPQGIYILKVEKEGAVLTKKVQISD